MKYCTLASYLLNVLPMLNCLGWKSIPDLFRKCRHSSSFGEFCSASPSKTSNEEPVWYFLKALNCNTHFSQVESYKCVFSIPIEPGSGYFSKWKYFVHNFHMCTLSEFPRYYKDSQTLIGIPCSGTLCCNYCFKWHEYIDIECLGWCGIKYCAVRVPKKFWEPLHWHCLSSQTATPITDTLSIYTLHSCQTPYLPPQAE